MDNLYWFARIQPSDYSIVGNTALYLSQLLQQDYPVIPGFVVPGKVFWEFIEKLGSSEPLLADLPHSSLHVNVDNPRQLQLVSQQIRQGISASTLPPLWNSALLSATQIMEGSAIILQPSLALPLKQLPIEILQVKNLADNLQYAGLLDSYICLGEPESLTLALKRVWAEFFRARSLFYWQRVGIGLHQLNLAVTVQPIYDAIASGTIQADGEQLLIKATWGLGLAIAKGEVLPDSYQINVKTGKTIASQLGNKTIAYRLSSKLKSSGDITQPKIETLTENSIQAYPLSEEQQKQYAIEYKYLKQLIDLCQRLSDEITPIFSIEWTICHTPSHSEPQLYITQFSPQPNWQSKIGEDLSDSPLLKSNLGSKNQDSKIPTQNLKPTGKLVRGIAAATGKVTALAQVIIGNPQNLEDIPPGRILVAQTISPNWLPWLKKAAGVVTEESGMTSHGAILAREIGIPAVVSAAGVTQLFQTGELLLVDGNRGEVKGVAQPMQYREEEERGRRKELEEGRISPLYSLSQLPIATELLVNLSQSQSLKRIEGLPVDGVGLLRSELMILDALENLHPTEWLRQGRKNELVSRIAQLIIPFAAAFMPRKVLYRSLDLPESGVIAVSSNSLSEQKPLTTRETSELPKRSSPSTPQVINHRGTRHYLRDPASFDVELAALGEVYARGYSNVQLMLPFVRTVEEFVFCRRRVEKSGLMDYPDFRLWIMAEVPSVLFLLPDYVKAGVQGISIGTNDLTQLLLAVERDSTESGYTANGCHPAVMGAIKQLIAMARDAGIPCSICGEAPAQYPELIDSLVRWGISSISVDVNNVENTYIAIARAEKRLLLEAARERIGN
ncbi:putative PEP-binding protein [Limnofasciculus baicalensis]|uniref:Phosphoenolpyruvate synthase n=1 Tax=Limnofasciculus baicalensis BBK-W-15 TaxID=2699891 RepID=A0AAE3KPX4_9CYAN|nr:putative PEP-binding protein [Limnofasciculus baicalensis]MCP2731266.1 PEP-utilizing enzyme [Limnofasciculus baicalensis BBK-W-15]